MESSSISSSSATSRTKRVASADERDALREETREREGLEKEATANTTLVLAQESEAQSGSEVSMAGVEREEVVVSKPDMVEKFEELEKEEEEDGGQQEEEEEEREKDKGSRQRPKDVGLLPMLSPPRRIAAKTISVPKG